MIKLAQVQTIQAECYLTFEYTHAEQTLTVTINRSDIIERLKTVKKILGRALTLQDAKLAIVRMINEIREGKQQLTEEFDYSKVIGVDLEA